MSILDYKLYISNSIKQPHRVFVFTKVMSDKNLSTHFAKRLSTCNLILVIITTARIMAAMIQPSNIFLHVARSDLSEDYEVIRIL